MSDNGMPKFRGNLPKPLDLSKTYRFDQDAEFVAAYLLEGDEAGKRTITRTDRLLVCQIELAMRRANLQHVIDVTMSLVDDAGQPKGTPEKVAEIRLNPEAARVCRAELYVARSVFMVYNRFLDWLWLEELIAGWRVQEIKQAETSASNMPQVGNISDGRIAKIRSMFSDGKSPSDKKIATELIVSESLAKKLRLQAGIKRRERKKSMS